MPRSRAECFFLNFFIIFNGQEQLCPLTCEGRRDLSNYTRMSTIQSRKLEKRPKKPCNTDLKISMKSLLHYPPTFLSTDSKMRGFSETLPTKIKPTKCPASWKKKWGKESENRGKERKRKVKVESVENVEILLSAHARTLQALILHLAEKAAECTTWKRVCREI